MKNMKTAAILVALVNHCINMAKNNTNMNKTIFKYGLKLENFIFVVELNVKQNVAIPMIYHVDQSIQYNNIPLENVFGIEDAMSSLAQIDKDIYSAYLSKDPSSASVINDGRQIREDVMIDLRNLETVAKQTWVDLVQKGYNPQMVNFPLNKVGEYNFYGKMEFSSPYGYYLHPTIFTTVVNNQTVTYIIPNVSLDVSVSREVKVNHTFARMDKIVN